MLSVHLIYNKNSQALKKAKVKIDLKKVAARMAYNIGE